MKRLIFIILLIPFFSFGQDFREYLPDVAWKTIVDSVVFQNTDTFTVKVNPIDLNDPGSFDKTIGNYLIDNKGRRYAIIDSATVSNYKVITVVDVFETGISPFQGKIGYVYNSAGGDNSKSLPSTQFEALDEKAFDYGYRIDNDILWKHGETIPFDSLLLDTTISDADYRNGKLYYDSTRNNLVFYDANNETQLDIGKESWVDVYNNTGTTITNGQVVFVDTSQAMMPTVELAKADLPLTIDNVIGLATHDIEDGTVGRITVFGIVRGLNTSGLTPGTRAWVSATTSGGVVDVRPEYPNYAIQVGEVLISDATDGQILVNKTGQIEDILHNAWNGNILESFDFLIASNGTTITGTLDEQGSKDYLTMNFSDGFTLLDVSTPPTITLNPGTDANPQLQYIYIPQSTKTLTVSNSYWPSEEHIPIAIAVLRSASKTQTDGALRNQNINDHIAGNDQQGHISHMAKRIRKLNAEWESGAEGGVTIVTNAGTPDNVYVFVTGGMVWQMHLQTFPAQNMQTGDDIHIVNHPTNPYATVTDLNGQLTDASGNSMSGRRFSIVVWGVQNKTGQLSHIMANLPTGTYLTVEDAINDADGYSVYNIPNRFNGVGFLIARFTFSHSVSGGGTWTLSDTEDLRGTIPSNIAGGGTSGAGGADSFTALDDTPNSYTGFGGYPVLVDDAETGLEFDLIDTTATKINQSNFREFIRNAEHDQVYAGDSANIAFLTDLIEVASIVEAQTGENNTKAITPLTLIDAIELNSIQPFGETEDLYMPSRNITADTITADTLIGESDPIYANDSANIVWFIDTVSTIATKYDINTITHFTNADETDPVWIADSSDYATKVKVESLVQDSSLVSYDDTTTISETQAGIAKIATLVESMTGENDIDQITALKLIDVLQMYVANDSINAHVNGTINGVNDTFTTNRDFVPNTTRLLVNGVEQVLGLHYTESGLNTIVFDASWIPETNEIIRINYKY